MIERVLLLLVFVQISLQISCTSCDFVLPNQYNIPFSSVTGLPTNRQPVICFRSGTYGAVSLQNFEGTTQYPLLITNCDGLVVFDTTASVGLKIESGRYLKLSGKGWPGLTYGIEIRNPTSVGLQIRYRSTNVEVENLHIHDVSFAGIMAKEDPDCAHVYTRGNYVFRQLLVHDNYIHDTDTGEAIYIGFSFFGGRNTSCNGNYEILYPHNMEGVRVYNNLVERTGWDGIQVGSAPVDVAIYGNRVINAGLLNNSVQGNCVQIGDGTTGLFYNNFLKNCFASGIRWLGIGNNTIFNNVVVNTGSFAYAGNEQASTIQGTYVRIFSNTFITTGDDSFKQFAPKTTTLAYNNIMLAPKTGEYFWNANYQQARSNFLNASISSAFFVNAAADNYHLTAQSTRLINAGEDLSAYNVGFDFDNLPRPAGQGWDIGAFEYGSTGTATVSTSQQQTSQQTSQQQSSSAGTSQQPSSGATSQQPSSGATSNAGSSDNGSSQSNESSTEVSGTDIESGASQILLILPLIVSVIVFIL